MYLQRGDVRVLARQLQPIQHALRARVLIRRRRRLALRARHRVGSLRGSSRVLRRT